MLDRSGLSMHAAALDPNKNIELIQSVGGFQRSLYKHAVGFVEEVRFEGLVIDYDFS
jgi:hypothetical protein